MITYDDLLTRLRDALAGRDGAAVAARLRERYRVVLVDEFQDTDPVQWDIMRRAFGDGGVTLVLIGDPKQAIYAFRGADVYAYLEAARGGRRAGDARRQLAQRPGPDRRLRRDVRRRAARPRGDRLPAGRGRAAEPEPRLTGAPVRAAADARRRIATTRSSRPAGGYAALNPPRASTSRATSRPTSSALLARARSRPRDDGDRARASARARRGARAHQPQRRARPRRAGRRRRPRRHQRRGQRVRHRRPARDWLRLLEAMERPASPAARTRGGADAVPRLDGGARSPRPTRTSGRSVHRRLHAWARVLRRAGVASLTETITLVEGLPERVLRDGRRRAAADRPAPRRPAAARAPRSAEQLGRHRADRVAAPADRRRPSATTGDEERSRRLESDAEAVQVLTIHRSKGLEFPVVYCPYLWEPGWIPTSRRRSSSTTRRGRRAHDRRRPGAAPDYTRHQRPARSSSSAARTCGSPTSR